MEHIDYIWVNEKFEQLERLSKAILEKLNGGRISPELEAAIRRSRGLSVNIDRKVPDQKTKKKEET